ncbi:MAG: glycosyltransferase family 2 protein [Aulosira sp. DedQUE10]|nr:glycosyltransferase family 2 protein [Aulosira sp. DedQUE10]
MSNSLRRLSIGLPVYNGEKFIRESIDSILAQTFQDFELIISDNASTDSTEEICRAYAAQDQRIRYYRNQTNIGCARNFNRVFELSTGEYFKWAAHDDLHAPDFLQKCIAILDQDPTVVLCHSHVYYIDQQGKFIQTYDIKFKTDSPKPQERFQDLLTKHYCYQMFGVIRAEAIKKIPPMSSCGAADAIFLLRLGLLGRFYEIPEYLFFARSHPQQSISMFLPNYLLYNSNNQKELLRELPDFYAYTVWFDTANAGKIIFPHWRILGEFLLSVWNAPLNWYEKLSCLLRMPKRLHETEYLLLKDLLLAAQTYWKFAKTSISVYLT